MKSFHTQPQIKSNKQGFTFIETLVAITVLLVAVVAPMSLAQDGIIAAKLAQDQIVAFYLGQEGVEIIKNLRDTNRLNNAPGGQMSGAALSNCIVNVATHETDDGCTVDATSAPDGEFETERCITQCDNLYLDIAAARTLYTQNPLGNLETKYRREVKVWYPDPTDTNEAVVEVVITWPFSRNGQPKTYKVKNYLYDW